MPVNTRHPEYDANVGLWARMRDAVGGEDAIKARGMTYLPVPSGMAKSNAPSNIPRSDFPATNVEHSPAFRNYISRARYPEMVAPAVEGMVGLIGRKEPEIDMPQAMDYLREQATVDGLSMDALIDRVRHEVAVTGRMLVLVEVDDDGLPFLVTYPAEAAINWRADGENITLLVLEEQVLESGEDQFEHVSVTQWRSLELEDGTYVVNIYRLDDNTKQPTLVEQIVPEMRGGQTLNFIPSVFIGSRDLLPQPDALPLLAVANKSLHYYRQSADHGLQIYMAAHGTTPYIFGVPEDDAPSAIGPAELWTSEQADTKAGFIEVSGSGLDASKQYLDETKQEIVQATIQAMSESKRDAEAAETLRLRFQAQTATLTSIAVSSARGLEKALRMAAFWLGVNDEPSGDAVTITQPTDFITEQPNPQVLSGLLNGVERGLMPETILSSYLRRVDLTEMTDEDFAAFTPAAQALASGDEEG